MRDGAEVLESREWWGAGVGNQCRAEPSVLILLVGTVAMTERTGLEGRKLRVHLGLIDKIQAKFCMGYIHPKTLFVVIRHSNLTRRAFFYVLDQPVGSDPHCVPDIGFADPQICRPSDYSPREGRCRKLHWVPHRECLGVSREITHERDL